jgi:predicted unusual protein kinase regulating ubiquinone biosynthesis (AarF/ABC1/UbiB family)
MGLRHRLSRAVRLGASSAWAGAEWTTAAALDALGGDAAARSVLRASSARVAASLGRMKGLAMKLGQYLSFALPDLPPEVRDALAVLQTSSAPRPLAELRGVIEADLGRPLEALYARFEPAPVAAASIGQVHRAWLADGTAVAVKVQYPAVAEAVRADLANAALLVRLVRALVPGIDAASVAAELRARLLEELDYRAEARWQAAFAARFRGHPFVEIPDVFPDRCAARVLTTRWAEGRDFRAALEDPPEVRARHAELLLRFLLGNVLGEGTFVADPHPGNYRFDAAGARAAFLDYGCVKALDAPARAAVREVVRGGLLGDRAAARRGAEQLGVVAPGEGEAVVRGLSFLYVPFPRDVVEPFPAVLSGPLLRAAAGAGLAEVRRDLRVPGPLPFLNRTVIGLYAVLGRLDAVGNWHRIAREYACGDAPSTPLGEAERAWRESAGRAP